MTRLIIPSTLALLACGAAAITFGQFRLPSDGPIAELRFVCQLSDCAIDECYPVGPWFAKDDPINYVQCEPHDEIDSDCDAAVNVNDPEIACARRIYFMNKNPLGECENPHNALDPLIKTSPSNCYGDVAQ